MAPIEAEALASSHRGAMMAAAGHGKTHVIAAAVAQHGGPRELILTHTHAGVDAIRKRLDEFHVSSKKYQLDTIAGWSLRLAIAFPGTAALSSPRPRSNREYTLIYKAVAQLLALSPIQEIVRASYSGVFVDEYQDCTIEQHAVILRLRDTVPCRVVGDPLQAIFGFGGSEIVSWEEQVRAEFDSISGPTKPWRWADSNPQLGDWLSAVRHKLEAGEAINLVDAPVMWVDGSNPKLTAMKQRDACFHLAKKRDESVIAIHRWPNQAHAFASRMNGVYSCVEAIDAPDLFKTAARFDEARGLERASIILNFACLCAAGVATQLGTIRAALAKGRVPAVKKFRAQLEALLAIGSDTGPSRIEPALESIVHGVPGIAVFRWELLREMIRSCEVVIRGEAATLSDACWIVRSRTRRVGRRISRHAVGTPQLVKGLEFDHSVLLDADAYEDAENLYVALTRASATLTIVSKSRTLRVINADVAASNRINLQPE